VHVVSAQSVRLYGRPDSAIKSAKTQWSLLQSSVPIRCVVCSTHWFSPATTPVNWRPIRTQTTEVEVNCTVQYISQIKPCGHMQHPPAAVDCRGLGLRSIKPRAWKWNSTSIESLTMACNIYTSRPRLFHSFLINYAWPRVLRYYHAVRFVHIKKDAF